MCSAVPVLQKSRQQRKLRGPWHGMQPYYSKTDTEIATMEVQCEHWSMGYAVRVTAAPAALFVTRSLLLLLPVVVDCRSRKQLWTLLFKVR
jgi:hypothetical protein